MSRKNCVFLGVEGQVRTGFAANRKRIINTTASSKKEGDFLLVNLGFAAVRITSKYPKKAPKPTSK